MIKNVIFILVSLAMASCNVNSKAGHGTPGNDDFFSLKVRPLPGSNIKYDISNETNTKFDVDGKKVENISKSDATVSYAIALDTTGNYVVSIKYDKIHVYTKVGENETDYDTENPTSDTDPVGQMFAALKQADIRVWIKSSGEVVRMDGYQQILDHVSNGINKEDATTRAIIQKQWKQMVEQSLVKKNLSLLFETFPDSSVHVGDKWNTMTRQTENVAFRIYNEFTLKSIDNGVAFLESSAKITTDSTATSIMGYSTTSELSGEQDGEFEINIKLGLPQYSKVTLDVDGTVQVNGRDIPFSLKSRVTMKGSQN